MDPGFHYLARCSKAGSTTFGAAACPIYRVPDRAGSTGQPVNVNPGVFDAAYFHIDGPAGVSR